MKKLILMIIIMAVAFLSSCSVNIDKTVVEHYQKCEKSGLKTYIVIDPTSSRVTELRCSNK